MAEIPFEPYTSQGKLRFWCQKVLPLVYDDSLSYYELLGKVVEYLNNTIEDVSACEDNITALRDAFVQLQEYVNEMFDDFAPEIERIIDEMIDSGEFGEILSGVVNGLIASEYDESTQYIQFAYCLKDDKLYCATASTTGTWDETKWRETTVGYDMQLLSRRLYNLNAGQVAYNPESAYNNATVGKELQELKGSLTSLQGDVSDLTSSTNKDNMSNTLFNTIEVASDLNSAKVGYLVYDTTSLNRPTNYGVVFTHRGSSWIFQTAISADGTIYRRRNINNTSWTSWQKEGAYFESLGTIFTLSNTYANEFEITEGVGYKSGNLVFVSIAIHRIGITTQGEKLQFATCSLQPLANATIPLSISSSGAISIRSDREVRFALENPNVNWYVGSGVFLINS